MLGAALAVLLLTVLVGTGVALATRDGDPPDAASGPAGASDGEGGADTADGGGTVDPVVTTDRGRVRGFTRGDLATWRGIPFAAPPVGARRWRPPAPARPWDGVRDGTRYGPSCVQLDGFDFSYGADDVSQSPTSDEDCLYLNVDRPAAATDDLPVVVWVHGGGFFGGSGASIDVGGLAARGAVVVSVNYRLGRLGFFAHPSLHQDVGNFGLLDQVAALQWVQANATAFGGDVDDVTVMGSSAGAMSVNALMAMPDAQGLFDRAIAHSAPSDAPALTMDEARDQGETAFPGLSAEQLRALPSSELLSSTFSVLRGDAPLVDAVLPEPSAVAFARGHEAAVPYLVGTTDAEFDDKAFRASGSDPGRARRLLRRSDPGLVDAYGRELERHLLPDLVFTLPAALLAREHAERAPTYRYRLATREAGTGHGGEVPYVFDLETPDGGAVADVVIGYWLAFARDGRPDADDLPAWPAASPDGTELLEIRADGPHPEATDPWTDRLGHLAAVADDSPTSSWGPR